MSSNRSSSPTDLIGRALFPGARRSRRRTNLRFLMLSIGLGFLVCGVLVLAFWLMN